MSEALRAVKGMNDILPPESARWEWFEAKVRALMQRYAYRNVRTPIVEPTALFVRGLGEVTDIVEKEMYSFEDAMNGDRLTLRPEATAGIERVDVLVHSAGVVRLGSLAETDAELPGITAEEARRLRERLTERGEARLIEL